MRNKEFFRTIPADIVRGYRRDLFRALASLDESKKKNDTPLGTIAACINEVGRESTRTVIASIINRYSWDGRISRINVEWAKTVETALDENLCLDWAIYPDMHLTHFDQIATEFIKTEVNK